MKKTEQSLKTQFQRDLTDLEISFKDYKNGFPKTFGEQVKPFVSLILIVVSIFMWFHGLSYDSITIIIAPVLFVAGIFVAVIEYRTEPDKVTIWAIIHDRMYSFVHREEPCEKFYNASPEKVLKKVEYIENTYKQYPDTNSFIQKFKESLNKEIKRKRNIRTIFIICCIGIVATYSISIAMKECTKDDPLQNTNSAFDVPAMILDLNEKTPFLRIKPLKTEISNGISLSADYQDFFIKQESSSQFDPYLLVTTVPKISGYKPNDKFRLIITDDKGKPLQGCYIFTFIPNQQQKVISHEIKGMTRWRLELIYRLKYMQNHQENVSFVVEKIEN